MLVGVLVIDDELHVSAVAKPLPEIDTLPPALMKVGLSVIVGPVTVSVAEAASPELPVTVMVYVPGVALAFTVKSVIESTPPLR
jgi:hypothetical protein